MQGFSNAGSGDIVLTIAQRIVENRGYLSDLDGLVGDGDHGVNMAKGFSLAAGRLRGGVQSLSASLATLGDVLMTEIGGSMGPLYGAMFSGFAAALDGAETIDAAAFEKMLRNGLSEVQSTGDAKVGDQTLIDAYAPALQAFAEATARGDSFTAALDALIAAAERGRDSTIDLVARIGRASRLGERSRGVLTGLPLRADVLPAHNRQTRSVGNIHQDNTGQRTGMRLRPPPSTFVRPISGQARNLVPRNLARDVGPRLQA